MLISAVDLHTLKKRLGPRGLLARKWFALNGPLDAPSLPLNYDEREDLKHSLYGNMVAWYARSFEGQNYDPHKHPSFDDYARGVMAAEERGEFVTFQYFSPTDIAQMKKRFPPRTLSGLTPGLCWEPPAVNGRKRLCLG
jgi:hypothetical protein